MIKLCNEIYDLEIGVVERGFILKNQDFYYCNSQDLILLEKLVSKIRTVNLISIGYSEQNTSHISNSNYHKIQYHGHNLNIFILNFKNVNKIMKYEWLRHIYKIIYLVRKCELLFVYMPSTLGVIVILISKIFNRKVIGYFGSSWGNTFSISYFEKNIKFIRNCKDLIKKYLQDVVCANSDLLLFRDNYFDYYYKRKGKNSYYVPGNTKIYFKDKVLRNLDKKTTVRLLSVCSILPVKGLENAIYAVNDLVQRGYNIEYSIIGEDKCNNYSFLNKIIQKENLDGIIIYHGHISDLCNLNKYYDDSDLFVLSSYSEGFPRVILEALARGLPVVATSVGGIPNKLTNMKDAMLIKPGDAKLIADAIIKLVENVSLRQELSNNGKIVVIEELKSMAADKIIFNWIENNVLQ